MSTIVKPLAKGLLTYIPGIQRLLPSRRGGGTQSASYCYGVWLKHLTLLWENGIRSIPDTLAELGPGDSLGVGLSAMLCGVNNYYALDVMRYSDVEGNVRVFDELLHLFQTRAPRPEKGWPEFDQYLNRELFPGHILTDELLRQSLSERRVAAIRRALSDPAHQHDGLSIRYMVPWTDASVIEHDSVDLILSHSVLEHVVDLEQTYDALRAWLKPGGTMTHQIDFKSHGVSKKWNGYRAYSEVLWKLLLGKRPYLINRQPHSVHVGLMKNCGFNILCDLQMQRKDGLRRLDLSKQWKHISDGDLNCSEAFVQAEKDRQRDTL